MSNLTLKAVEIPLSEGRNIKVSEKYDGTLFINISRPSKNNKKKTVSLKFRLSIQASLILGSLLIQQAKE